MVFCFNEINRLMKTSEETTAEKFSVPPIPDKLHPTVQAFVDKKVEQARESLKEADLSAILRDRQGNQ